MMSLISSSRCSWGSDELDSDVISLQDLCKLYLLATINEYPVDMLAKLPIRIRKKLFMAMPVVDRLHYEGTVFLNGLEVVAGVNPDALEAELQGTHRGTHFRDTNVEIVVSDMVTRSVMNSNKVYLCDWQTSDHFTQDMVEILFPPLVLSKSDFKRYCVINFARGCFDSFHTVYPNHGSIFRSDLSCYCVKSLNLKRFQVIQQYTGEGKETFTTSILNVVSAVKPEINSPCLTAEVDDHNLIMPSRLAKFIRTTTELYPNQLEFEFTHFEAFVKYCKFWSRIPKVVEIDCTNGLILESPLWKYFLTRHTQPDGGRMVYSYLKKLLSSVETLQLSTSLPSPSLKPNVSQNFTVLRDLVLPVIRSCAGHNMESRNLKQIEITSTKSLGAAMELLVGVQEFLCRGADRYATIFNNNNVIVDDAAPSESSSSAPLDFHHNKPYLIESLSVIVNSTPFFSIKQIQKKEVEMKSRSLLERFRDILVQQLPSLKHVAVKLLIEMEVQAANSFPWPAAGFADSIYTIMPTFIDFVRQPQFQSLSLTMMTPDLLDAFLTTPATHDQLLSIEGFTVWADQPHLTDKPDLGDIPSSNLKFKSLDVSSSNSVCSDKVMATHILRLKMLRIPVESLLSVHEDAIIEVSHVKIDLIHHQSPASSLFYPISLFLQKNVHLTILELFPCKMHNLLLVNHCLEQLTKLVTLPRDPVNQATTVTPLTLPPGQCRPTVQEIHLHFDTPLVSYVTGSQYGGNVPKGLSPEELNQLIGEYNQPLFILFVLIRILGELQVIERLVIVANDLIASNFRYTNIKVLRRIVNQSGDGKVKKIVLKGYKNLRRDLEIFELIAKEVVIDS